MVSVKKNLFLQVLLILFISAVGMFGATTSGTLTTDEVWEGTVLLTGDVTVPEGITLTVRAGTTVTAAALSDDTAGGTYPGKVELLIGGSLICEGTDINGVSFGSAGDVAAPGDWGGIFIEWELGAKTGELTYTTIEHATTGLSWKMNSGINRLVLDHAAVRYALEDGIYITAHNGSKPEYDIRNSILADNGRYGLNVFLDNSETILEGDVHNTTITGNNNVGVYLYYTNGKSILDFTGNTISGNKSHGVYSYLNYTNERRSIYTITGNTIDANQGYGIYLNVRNGRYETTIENNTISNSKNDGMHLNAVEHYGNIRNNIIHNNTGRGLYVNYAKWYSTVLDFAVAGNYCHDNGSTGIDLRVSGTVTPERYTRVYNNRLINNVGTGLYCNMNHEVLITHNEITGNNQTGVQLACTRAALHYNNLDNNFGTYTLCNDNINIIDARFNYWGPAITTEMSGNEYPYNITKIRDIFDNTAYGAALYSGYLAEAPVVPVNNAVYVTTPMDGDSVVRGEGVIRGFGFAAKGIAGVQVTDGTMPGTWQDATRLGDGFFTYTATYTGGTYDIQARMTDASGDTYDSPINGVTVDTGVVTTSGTLTADELWEGEVVITGDVIIPAGITVTVAPGTTVKFAKLHDDTESGVDKSRCELIVKGSLRVNGTDVQPVTFTSATAYPAKYDWYGIRGIHAESNETIIINHAVVEYAYRGIHSEVDQYASTVDISNSRFHDNQDYGILLITRNGASGVFSVTDCSADLNTHGISMQAGYTTGYTFTGTIRGCTVTNNSNHGVYAYCDAGNFSLDVADNTIHSNGEHGIYLYQYRTGTRKSTVSITGNTITHNKYGIHKYVRSSGGAMDLLIDDNVVSRNTEGLYLANGGNPYVPVISNNMVHHNTSNGIYARIDNSDSPEPARIINNTVYANGTYGINIYKPGTTTNGELAVLAFNTVYANGTRGIHVNSNDPVNIVYNDIYDNTGDGMYLLSGAGTMLHFNNIMNNDRNGSGSYDVSNNNASYINAAFNYWGPATTTEMQTGSNPKNITKIFDMHDDDTKGYIDYTNWYSDQIPPAVGGLGCVITSPQDATLKAVSLKLSGVAAALQGIKRVEISADNGATWTTVTGKERWSYDWTVPADGTYVFRARVIDSNDVTAESDNTVTIVIDSTLPTTSGTLANDENWRDEVIITGDITVPAGINLTIEPGATIKFSARSDDQGAGLDTTVIELNVHGTFNAAGTVAEPISFTSTSGAPAKNDWYGINIYSDDMTRDVVFDHCTVEYAKQGVNLESHGSILNFAYNNGRISHTSGDGIAITSDTGTINNLTIGNNTITDHGRYGVYCHTQSAGGLLSGTVRDNTVTNNGNHGMYFYTTASSGLDLDVTGNTVSNNNTWGLVFNPHSNFDGTLDLVITDNTVDTNSYGGIYLYSYYSNTRVSLERNAVFNNKYYNGDSYGVYVLTRGGRPFYTLVSDNDVYGNQSPGIFLYGYRNGTPYTCDVLNNRIYNNNGRGLYINKGSSYVYPTVMFNKVYDNNGSGLYVNATDTTHVLYNIFRNNQSPNIQVLGAHDSMIRYNNMVDTNGAYAMQNSTGNSVHAGDNYWGIPVTDEMNAGGNPKNIGMIYDRYDAGNIGRIDYVPYADQTVDVTGDIYGEILIPRTGTTLNGSNLRISGIAGARYGIAEISVSVDDGATWTPLAMTSAGWYYDWSAPADGEYTIRARITDKNDATVEVRNVVTITADGNAPTTSGTLTYDEVWQGDVLITGDVIVPEGVTLTLMPGTTVTVLAGTDDRKAGVNKYLSELIINGQIDARGTSDQPITFTSSALMPLANDWYGIAITGNNSGIPHYFEYCVIDYTVKPLTMTATFNAELRVSDSKIRYSSNNGIYFYNLSSAESTLTLVNNEIHDHALKGIHVDTRNNGTILHGTVSGNRLYNCVQQGFYLYNYNNALMDLVMRGNEIFNNTNIGVQIDPHNDNELTSDITFENNNVYDNSNHGVFINAYYTATAIKISGNTIRNNNGHGLLSQYRAYHNEIEVSHNLVADNTNHGIYVYPYRNDASVNARIFKNTVYGNTIGILAARSLTQSSFMYPAVTYNDVYNNRETGISCVGNAGVTVLYNTVHDNLQDGIKIYGGNDTTVNFNTITGNGGVYALYNEFSNSINAMFNYWGPILTAEMNTGGNPKNISGIYDVYDDDTKGTVDYAGWLNSDVSGDEANRVHITSPLSDSVFATDLIRITGVAAAKDGVKRVEVSPDGAINWYPVTGIESWYYDWEIEQDGTYTIIARVIDRNDTIAYSTQTTVVIDNNRPTTSGMLVADETWDGEVVITGDVYVPENITLSILPGTTIRFDALKDDRAGGADPSRCELIIEGTLNAAGSFTSPIYFTSTSVLPAKNDWYGIRVINEHNAKTITLAYCNILYVNYGLDVTINTSPLEVIMTDSQIGYAANHGISVVNTAAANSKITVAASHIHHTDTNGLYLTSSGGNDQLHADITGNIVTNASGYGIYYRAYGNNTGTGFVSIRDNTVHTVQAPTVNSAGIFVQGNNCPVQTVITGNDISYCRRGIDVNGHNYARELHALIADNTIYKNTETGLYVHNGYNHKVYAEVVRNAIYDNGLNGIELARYNSSQIMAAVVAFNTIGKNSNAGILVNSGYPVKIHYNTLSENGLYDIGNQTGTPIDARYNAWDADVTAVMNSGTGQVNISTIYDLMDNNGRGKVDYTDWLAVPYTNAGNAFSKIIEPANGAVLRDGLVTLTGIAYAAEGIDHTGISFDNGTTWKTAGTRDSFIFGTAWEYTAQDVLEGVYSVRSRTRGNDGAVEDPADLIALTIDNETITLAGTIYTDEVWHGTIRLTGDVTISENATVTIMPGTVVEIPANTDTTHSGKNSNKIELIVNGSLMAGGLEAEPIMITGVSDEGEQPGDWYGIYGSGNVYLNYSTIQYAQTAVTLNPVQDMTTDISNSIIRYNAGSGIYIEQKQHITSAYTVSNNTITNNTGYGLYYYTTEKSETTLGISGNTLAHNGERGMHINAYSRYNRADLTVDITNNQVSFNTKEGIYLRSSGRSDMYGTVTGNEVFNNTTNIYYYQESGAHPATLTISGNTVYNGSTGIMVDSANAALDGAVMNNEVYGVTGDGIFLQYTNAGATDAPRITGNSIHNNGSRGLYLNLTIAGEVRNNSIYDNLNYGLYNDSVQPVDATFNWWGTETTNEIITGDPNPKNIVAIYDTYDEGAKGTVTYTDWLMNFTVPGIPVLNGVTTPTGALTQRISGTKDAGTSIVLNGREVIAVTNDTTWDYTVDLDEGINRFTLYSANPAGMVSDDVDITIVRDTKAPVVFSSYPKDLSAVKKTIDRIDITLLETTTTIDETATLSGASVTAGAVPVGGQWYIDRNHVWFVPDTALSTGDYTVSLNPADTPLANTGSALVRFSVDLTPPVAPVVDSYAGMTKASTLTLTGQKEAGTALILNGSEIVALDDQDTWTHTVSLSEGNNAFSLYARDAADNKSTSTSVSIVRDTVAPQLIASDPVNDTYMNESTGSVRFTYRDASTAIDKNMTLSTAVIRDSGNNVINGTWDLINDETVTFTPAAFFIEESYVAEVTCYDLVGNTRHNVISFTFDKTPPAVPGLAQVSSPTNFSIQTLTGTKDAQSAVYLNGTQIVPRDSALSWEYVVTLSEGVNTLRISAKDAAGNESGAVIATIEYDNTAPLPVTQLTADGSGVGTAVNLDWTGYDEAIQGDVDYYTIYISTNLFTQLSGMTPYATVDSGNFTYTVESLLKDTQYYFAVVAVDSKTNFLSSVTPVTGTPRDTIPPEEVRALHVDGEASLIDFTWLPPVDVQGDWSHYRVYADGPGLTIDTTVDKTIETYRLNGLNGASAYNFRITTVDNDGNESDGVSRTGITWLDNPQNIITDSQNGYINVTWDAAGPAQLLKEYRVYASESPFTTTVGMQPKVVTGATGVKVAGLTNNTTYYIAITAVNNADSENHLVTTVSAAPTPDQQGPEIMAATWNGAELTDDLVLGKTGVIDITTVDPMGIGRVVFLIDGLTKHMDVKGPAYQYTWKVADVADGPHTIGIRAYDTINNMTEKTYTVQVALAAPDAPVMTKPASALVTNDGELLITGTAESNAEIIILNNTVVVPGTTLYAGINGAFSTTIALQAGDNAITVKAKNRGGESVATTPVVVTYDTDMPDAPVGLAVKSLEGGTMKLSWTGPADGLLAGYNVYRAEQSFESIGQAVKMNGSLVTLSSYEDVTPYDATYYYGVTSVDTAHNESVLSPVVAGAADGSAPVAVEVVYSPVDGAHDTSNDVYAPGIIDVALMVNEPLSAVPYLALTAEGVMPLVVELQKVDDYHYSGFFALTTAIRAERLTTIFSARDMTGNRGTLVLSGNELAIDTRGPAVTKIAIVPESPVKNDQGAPTTVIARINLDETVKAGTMPVIRYRINDGAYSEPDVLVKTSTDAGYAETYELQITLPADAGLTGVDTLTFSYEAADDLDNQSTTIDMTDTINSFEIYQGALPPLAVPQLLSATPGADGMIRLDWLDVDHCDTYQLYRQAPGETELTEYTRVTGASLFDDATTVDGEYTYTVASVRVKQAEEAISAMSGVAAAIADATAPAAPINLELQLVNNGIYMEWNNGGAEEVTYTIYRADRTEITAVEGLTSLDDGIPAPKYLDRLPSYQEHCYVVTAVDAAGNESEPSNSFYLNFTLLPVSNVAVVVNESDYPVITWGHSGKDIDGFDVYLHTQSGQVKINDQRLTAKSFTDSGYRYDKRIYSIVAVDIHGVKSPERVVTLPDIDCEPVEGMVIKRGIMNRVNYTVTNDDSESYNDMELVLNISGHTGRSGRTSIDGYGTETVSVIFGGHSTLPENAVLTETLRINAVSGEVIEWRKSRPIDIYQGMLSLSVENQELVRGTSGNVRFVLGNTCEEEIEIVTASAGGTKDSPRIRFHLTDRDNNIISTGAFKQVSGPGVITLSNGLTVARIAPGAFFESDIAGIDIPLNLPEEVYVQVEIDHIYYHLGDDDQAQMDGIRTRHAVTLIDTAYYGEISTISPAVSYGDEPIMISGRAIDRSTGQVFANVPLKLIIMINGFEKVIDVYSDATGHFDYEYVPADGEAGEYKVCALHPDLNDRMTTDGFVIKQISIDKKGVVINAPVNYAQPVTVNIKAGVGTTLSNLRAAYLAEEQPGGVLPDGIFVDTGDVVPTVAAGETCSLVFNVVANNNAAAEEEIVIAVVSDESGDHIWKRVLVRVIPGIARPVLSVDPPYIDTGVSYNNSISETLSIENSGFDALTGVALSLRDAYGAVPDWAYISSGAEIGDIAAGDRAEVTVTFMPTLDVEQGVRQLILTVMSSNHEAREIPLYVFVTQEGEGSVLFKVADIYTGTTDEYGALIEGLAGAEVYIQNQLNTNVQYTQLTDNLGETLFTGLPAGMYKYRLKKPKHSEKIGSFWVKSGITVTEDVFLKNELVSVEWEVNEITINDKYEIVLNATYETDVPAAVVVMEPSSITIPDMEPGDSFTGEIKFTNYGLIQAEEVSFELPDNDKYYQYELLNEVPSIIGAKEVVKTAYRVTCLSKPGESAPTRRATASRSASRASTRGRSSGGCGTYVQCKLLWYIFKCSNGSVEEGTELLCWTKSYGTCSGDTGTGTPGGGGGIWIYLNGGGGSGPGGYPVSQPADPIDGVVCGPKIYCEIWDECCKANAREKVKSTVDLLTGEYSDDVKDISIMISGEEVSISRYYFRDTWHFPDTQLNLEPVYVLGNEEPDFINMGGVSYEKADDKGTVYKIKEEKLIYNLPDGYTWENKKTGEYKQFDKDGKLLVISNTYGKKTHILYEDLQHEDRVTGYADDGNTKMLWFDYDTDGRLTGVHDAAGREVIYEYTAGLLTKVTGVTGQSTTYLYDGDGRIYQKHDAAGNYAYINYYTNGAVKSVLNDANEGKYFEYNYDKARKEYYIKITYTSGKILEHWYDQNGVRVRTDVNGVTIKRLIIDGRKKTEIDAYGNKTIRHYDEWDNLIREINPDGTYSTHTYDSQSQRLIEELDTAGIITRYQYDASGDLSLKIEAAGTADERKIGFDYDGYGNVIEETYYGDTSADTIVITRTFDDERQLLTETDGEGNTYTYTYDDYGNVKTITDPMEQVWTYTYDPDTLLLKEITDPLLNTVSYDYDILGNLKESRDVNNLPTTYDYDNENRLITYTDPYNRIMRYEYDFEGRITKTVYPNGDEYMKEYDANGKMTKQIFPDATAQTIEYNEMGRSVRGVSRNGVEMRAEYSVDGRLEKLIYPTYTESYTYDERGRMTTIVKDDGDTTITLSNGFDGMNNVVSKKDSYGRELILEYDSFRRLVKKIDFENNVFEYTYNKHGNVSTYTDSNKKVTRFYYDKNNRIIRKEFPDGKVLRCTYDKRGRMTAIINPDATMITYTYDEIGRLMAQDHYDSTDDQQPAVKHVTYDRDKSGRINSWNDGEFSAVFTYDDANMTVSKTIDYGTFTKTFTYEMNIYNQKKAMIYPDGTRYEYDYNTDGKLGSITLPGAGTIAYAAFDMGNLEEVILPGGMSKRYQYDSFMRLSGIDVTDIGGTPIMSERYTRDLTGSVTDKATLDALLNYTYDDNGQLTGVSRDGAARESYTYDPMGNRLTSTVSDTWQYNDLNQLTLFGDIGYTYDDNGNRATKTTGGDTLEYSYDAVNRLTKIENTAGTVIAEYAYDIEGHRLKKTTGGVTTYYLYAEEGLIAEFDAAGNELVSYGYEPDAEFNTNPLFMKKAGEYYYYLNDYLGTPQKLVGANGGVVWAGEYDGFGLCTVTVEQVENNMRGSSQYYDSESGLHYNLNRYYDPDIGRYMTRDPIGEAGGENIYLFANNNPIGFIDPLGLNNDWEKTNCVKLSFSVGFSVSAVAGLGVSIGVSYEECDCCNKKTGEYRALDYQGVTLEVTAELKLGALGFEVEIGFFKLSLEFSLLTLSGSRSVTIEKKCAADGYSVKVVLLKIEGKAFSVSASATAFGYGVVAEGHLKASAEIGFEADTKSITLFAVAESMVEFTGHIAMPDGKIEPLPPGNKNTHLNKTLSYNW